MIGYWIGECYVWQGYMCEVIKVMVYYVFMIFDFSWFEVGCLLENVFLCGFLESCGYKYEGVV